MPRLRTDQACLDAQGRSQVAQQLTAELAVSCPDCGVEAGRSCRDSFDRAVRTHLARSVAAHRRDTEPCPAPSRLEQIQELNAAQESLTRAAAREFYEQVITDADRAIRETLQGMQAPRALTQLPWLEKAQTGGDFFAVDKTPTASDCAPSPAASAPDADCNGVAPSRGDSGRPVCACGQTIWNELTVCGDCRAENVSALLCMPQPAPLDKRIREAQPDDATECAWSTPTSDGEGWT
jgi:hypothetical protein